MKQLVKGSSILTAVSIGEMLMRFVRTKFIALFLGPAGTGFLAQLTIFFEALRVWGDLGSRRGVIKQVAERRREGKDSERYKEIVTTSFFLALVASLITGIAVAFFSKKISLSLYGNPDAFPYIIFLAVLLPLASMSTITASIVKGNLDFRPFAVYTLCSYFFVILLTPFLIYYWRAWGAMTSMGLFFIFPLVGYLVYNARSGFLRFSRKVSRPALTEQFSYGSLHIYQDSLTHISRILIAAWVVRSLGLDAMGIYQVAITFSTVYLSIPMQAISGYTLPMIASAETHDEINKAVNDSLRFLLFLIVPIIASLMIWPEIFIRIFYSGDFLSAAPILRLQLLGTFFTLMMQAVGSGLSAKGKLKAIFVGATLHPLVFLGISYAFFEPFGIQGIAAGYSLSYAVLFTVYFLFMRHYFKTALYPKNLRLIFASLVWLATPFVFGYITHSLNYRILMFSFAIPWFFISSKDHEREYLYSKLRGIFRLKGSSPGKNKKVKV